MSLSTYQPAQTITGPAYSPWFKLLATIVCGVLAVYGVSVAWRFPLLQYGVGVQLLLLSAAVMLVLSYYWFMRSTITIDDKGIIQTGIYNRHVSWQDIRSAKLLGVPYASAVFPPRLVVRTNNTFSTFNGGNSQILTEFAKITLAYQLKQ
jgi:hypothetical protein